jgi:hypothetical protein
MPIVQPAAIAAGASIAVPEVVVGYVQQQSKKSRYPKVKYQQRANGVKPPLKPVISAAAIAEVADTAGSMAGNGHSLHFVKQTNDFLRHIQHNLTIKQVFYGFQRSDSATGRTY